MISHYMSPVFWRRRGVLIYIISHNITAMMNSNIVDFSLYELCILTPTRRFNWLFTTWAVTTTRSSNTVHFSLYEPCVLGCGGIELAEGTKNLKFIVKPTQRDIVSVCIAIWFVTSHKQRPLFVGWLTRNNEWPRVGKATKWCMGGAK